MTFILARPVTNHGQRLYYRSSYDINDQRTGGHYLGRVFHPPQGKGVFQIADPMNVLSQIRVWRWMMREYNHRLGSLTEKERSKPGAFSDAIFKDDLRDTLFPEQPNLSTRRLGRMIRMVVPYETSFQRNRSEATGWRNLMYWRWCHPLEIAYGIEHLMVHWMPKVLSDIHTQQDWDEELEILLDARPEEDHELLAEMQRQRAD